VLDAPDVVDAPWLAPDDEADAPPSVDTAEWRALEPSCVLAVALPALCVDPAESVVVDPHAAAASITAMAPVKAGGDHDGVPRSLCILLFSRVRRTSGALAA
jgi:hypothetical protein